MHIGEVCNREVITVKSDTPVLEAARLMREFHVGDLVVVQGNGRNLPVGILTDRDIVVEIVAKDVPVAGLTVGEIMSRTLVSARESEDVFEIIERMQLNGVRRMPIVDDKNNLIGIVSLVDLLEILAEEMLNLSKVSPIEEMREMKGRA